MTIKTNEKAGGFTANHNQRGIAVKSAVKVGGITINHNQTTRHE